MEEDCSPNVSEKLEEANVLCPVCFESLLEADRLALPGTCVHVFCLDCITAWSSYSNSCPIDRLQFDQIVVKEYVDGPVLETIVIKNKKSGQPADDGIIEVTNCEICGLSNDEESLLLCDGCDRAYHCACLDPPLLEVPVDDWFCERCNVRQVSQIAGPSSTPTTRQRSTRTRSVARTRFAERVRAEVQIAREMASDFADDTPRSSRRKRRSLLLNTAAAISQRSEEAGAVAIRRRLVNRLGLIKSRDCPGLSQYGIRGESKGSKTVQTVQLNLMGSVRDCTPIDTQEPNSPSPSKRNETANPNLLSSILQSQDVLMLPDHRVHISTSGNIKTIKSDCDATFDINKAVLGSPSKAHTVISGSPVKLSPSKCTASTECERVLESFMTESPENNEVSIPPTSAETELPCQAEKLPVTDDGVKMDAIVEMKPQDDSVELKSDNHNGSQSDDSFHGLNISPFKAKRKLSNSENLNHEKASNLQHEVSNPSVDCFPKEQVNSIQCNQSDQAKSESAELPHSLPEEVQNSGHEEDSLQNLESDKMETPLDPIDHSSKDISKSENIELPAASAENEEPLQKEPSKTNVNPSTDLGGIQFQLKKKDYEIPKKSKNADDGSGNKLTMSDVTKEPSAEELEKFGLPPQFNNYLNERAENAGGSEKESYTRRNFNDFNSNRGGFWPGSRGGFQAPRDRWGNPIDIEGGGRVNRNYFGRGGFRGESRDGDHFGNQRNRFESQNPPNRVSKWEPIGEKREIQPPPFEPPRKDDTVISSGQSLPNHSNDHVPVDVKPLEEAQEAESQPEETQQLGDAPEAKSPSRKRGHSETNNPESSEQPLSRNRSRSKSSDSRKRRRERSSSRRRDRDGDRDSRRSRERHNKDYSSRNRDSDDHRSSRHRRSRSRSRRRNESDRYGRSDYRRHHSRGNDEDYSSRHKRSSHRDDHGSRRHSRHDEDRDKRRHDDYSDRRSKEETESKSLESVEQTTTNQLDVPEPEKVGSVQEQSTPTKDEPNFEFATGSLPGSHGFQEISKSDSDGVDTSAEVPDFGPGAPFMRFALGAFDANRPRFRGDFSPRNRFQRNPRPNFQHHMHAPPMMNPALNAMVNPPRMSAQQQQSQQPQQQFAQMVSPNPQQRFAPPASFQSPTSGPAFANPAFSGAPGLPAGVPPQNFLGGRIPFPFNNQQMRGQQPFPPNFLQQFAANMGNPNATAESQALLQGNDIRSVMNPQNLNAVGFPPAMGQDGAANTQANMTAALLNQIESNKLLQSISSHPAAAASVFGTHSPQQQQLQEAANLLKDIKTTPTAVSAGGSSNPAASAAAAAVSPISLATIQSNMPMINNILESQLFQPPPPNNVEAANTNPLSFFQQQGHKPSSIIPETFFSQNSSPQSVEMEDSAGVNESSMHGVGSPSNSIGQPAVGGVITSEEPPFLRSLTTGSNDMKTSAQAIPFMEPKMDNEPLEKGISLVKEMLKKKNSGNFGEDNSGSDHHSDIESSANEMQLKKKLVDRSEMQSKVADLVKSILMPHFKKKSITKDEYKDIMRKSVNKVVKRGSADIKEDKISKLVNAYVDHYRAKRTKSSKDDDHDLF